MHGVGHLGERKIFVERQVAEVWTILVGFAAAVNDHLVAEVVDALVRELPPFGIGESAAYLDSGLGVCFEPLATTQGTVEAAWERYSQAYLVGAEFRYAVGEQREHHLVDDRRLLLQLRVERVEGRCIVAEVLGVADKVEVRVDVFPNIIGDVLYK